MKMNFLFSCLSCLIIPLSFSDIEPNELSPYFTMGGNSNSYLEKSLLIRRLLLVFTIDGTIFAFDKYSGAYLWMNNEVGGPLVNRTANSQVDSLDTSHSYFLEPLGDGTIYAYTEESGFLKLPINIKKLVSEAPSQWPDGSVFLGHKSTLFFAIRLSNGELLFKYSPEDTDFVPSQQLIDAFSGNDPDVLLVSRINYQLSCFKSSEQRFEWKLSFSEFSSCNSPFDEDQKPSKKSSAGDTGQKNIILYSSINRFLIARDPFTLEILWIRRFPSIPIISFKLQSPESTWRNLFGPLLHSIQFTPRPRYSDTESEEIYVGQEGDTLFVLPTDIFPFYRHVPENIHLIGEASAASEESPFEEETYNIKNTDCSPGSLDYPGCLAGVHLVRVIDPVPLLSEGTVESSFVTTRFLLIGLFTFAVAIITFFIMKTRFILSTTNSPSTASMTVERPPGFETISISSADTLYRVQDEDSSISPPKNFTITDEIIGYGSHGTVVFKGEFGGRPVAVKRMLSQFFELAGHEVALLQETDHHPNVIRYYCKEQSEKFTYIVLELCKYSLADLIEDHSSTVTSADPINLTPQKILFQITSGLAHLHEMKLIHRDLKPQNILITMQDKLVISDFGLGKKLVEGQSSFNPTIQAGTVGWRAPECILLEEIERFEALKAEKSTVEGETPRLSKNIDIFALGCIFFYVLSEGGHPFGDRLYREVNILSGKCNLSPVENLPEAHDLISRMISKKAADRPSCDQILAHPYFWEASKQISFILDLSDRFEYEDRLPDSEILVAFERRRKVIFEGNSTWNRLIDAEVWNDLLSFRKYNAHSARDLLRAIRNKKSHFHELSLDLRSILGETPEAFMAYFIRRFPRLLIEAYHVVESTPLRRQNPFCTQYFI